jgi:hypothetical protein
MQTVSSINEGGLFAAATTLTGACDLKVTSSSASIITS